MVIQTEQDVQQYLEKHKVQTTVEAAINAAVKADAADGLGFISEFLASKTLAGQAPTPAAAPSIQGFDDAGLVWRHEPGSGELGGSWSIEDGELTIAPAAQRDFWSRTFYSPCLVKNDGQALLATVAAGAEATLSVAFTFSPRAQFDQAGVLIRVDDSTWVKAGIEYADGAPRLSCVITNGHSDWSAQPWAAWDPDERTTSIRLRVHKVFPGPEQGPCLVFEAAPYEAGDTAESNPEAFSFVRIGSLRSGANAWEMGPMCFAPIEAGCSTRFHYISLGEKLEPVHANDSSMMTSN